MQAKFISNINNIKNYVQKGIGFIRYTHKYRLLLYMIAVWKSHAALKYEASPFLTPLKIQSV